MYSFSYLEPVCCSMSSSNCCFLTCIQISQGGGQVVWYSHLCQNFPQFIVIHTVKGFGIVIKAEIDIFLELSCFLNDPSDVGNLISGSSAFSTWLTKLRLWAHLLAGCPVEIGVQSLKNSPGDLWPLWQKIRHLPILLTKNADNVTSLVVQGLRICLTMQGTWVWFLVRDLRSCMLLGS